MFFTKKLFRPNIVLLILLILAVFLRVTVFFSVHPWGKNMAPNFFSNDGLQYHSIAQGIVFNKSFFPVDDYLGLLKLSRLELSAKRTPLYPLFLAFFYFLFGIRVWPVLLAQIFLDVLIMLFIYLVAQEIFADKNLALVAAFFYSFNLISLYYCNLLFTEILFTFFLTLAVWCFIKALKNNQTIFYLLTGFLIGLTTLTRPIAVYFYIILEAFIILKKGQFKSVLINLLCVVLAFQLVVVPWQIRNLVVFGKYALTDQEETNWYYWNTSLLKSKLEKTDPRKMIKESKDSLDKNGEVNPFKKAELARKLAEKYFWQHPREYFYYSFLGSLIVFFSPVYDQMAAAIKKAFPQEFLSFTWFLFYGQYFFLVLGMILMYLNKKERMLLFFLILTILYFVLGAGILGLANNSSRFRLPVTPLIFIISAKGIVETLKFFAQRFLKRKSQEGFLKTETGKRKDF